MNYFVTAIGTDSGKTVISAALALALDADYWKPIQAGYPTDTSFIENITKGSVATHPEAFILNTPASPHYAAKVDNINIQLADIKLPQTSKNLIIEGAGGCLVPINDDEFVIGMARHWNAEVILISNNYLGSINHTLLTINYLIKNNIKIKCIIFNDHPNPSTEEIIMKYAPCPCLYKVGRLDAINAEVVDTLSKTLKSKWDELE